MSKLTEEQRLAVVARYAGGDQVKAIAADFGISITYVGRLARRRGMPGRRLSVEQRADLIERYRRGEPTKVIAGHFNIGVSYVCKVARKAGLPRRITVLNVEMREKSLRFRRERELAETSQLR